MLSPANTAPTPNGHAPGDLDRGQRRIDAHEEDAPVDLHGGHGGGDTHAASAPASSNGNGQPRTGSQRTRAVADTSPSEDGQRSGESHGNGADPSEVLLEILTDRLNDVEALRKATSNQLSALTRSAEVPGGKGISEFSRAAEVLGEQLAILKQFEHRTVLELQRAMRAHPLGPWVKRTVGIGEKQGARLIAAIGDPYMRPRMEYDDGTVEESRPRLVSELRSYCGYGDASKQKRRKGVRDNWNAEAKTRAHLCAEKAQMAGVRKLPGHDDSNGYDHSHRKAITPYGEVYLRARANWADRRDCPTCKDGVCTDGHKESHALRLVAKAILKDLWREARTRVVATPQTDPSVSPAEELAAA